MRPGVCAVPTRGPSRYFGGDEALAGMAAEAVAGVGGRTSRRPGSRPAWGSPTACSPPSWPPGPHADGGPVIVPPGETPAFLAPWPVAALDRPELADLLVRLGVRTLGGFAALPGPQVLARFGEDGALCQRVARGVEGELPGLPPASSPASAPDRPAPRPP